jgi:hypothetical protein
MSVSLRRQLWFWGLTIILIVAVLWLLHGILPPSVAGLPLVCLLMIVIALAAFYLICDWKRQPATPAAPVVPAREAG